MFQLATIALLGAASIVPAPSYSVDQQTPEGFSVSAGLGGGVVDGDVVIGVSAGVGLETVPFGLHLSLPLTLRVLDLAPEARVTAPACRVIRCEEWLADDALSADAIGRVVEEVRVFQAGDAFHLRGGRLFATLGHGQLVSRYTNAADWDRRRSGVYLEGNLPWARTQLQGLAGGFLSPHELFAARVEMSPLATRGADGAMARLLGRMRVGFEVAGDAIAPVGAATDASGDVLAGSASRPVLGVSADLAWPLLDDTGLQLEPWIGASALLGLVHDGAPGMGAGAALGIAATLDAIFVALRGSARLSLDGPRHRSAVFSTLYDVDRRRVLLATGAFARHGVADLEAPGGVGGAGSLELIVLRAARLGARLHVDPVPEATQVEVYGELGVGPVVVGVRGLQRAWATVGDAISFGDRTLVVAEAAWAVFPPFSAFGRWLHAPRFDPAAGGDPRADDDVVLGASVDLSFE